MVYYKSAHIFLLDCGLYLRPSCCKQDMPTHRVTSSPGIRTTSALNLLPSFEDNAAQSDLYDWVVTVFTRRSKGAVCQWPRYVACEMYLVFIAKPHEIHASVLKIPRLLLLAYE